MKLPFHFSTHLWKRKWSKQRRKDCFHNEATALIDSLAQARAKSTIDNYRTALVSFCTYSDQEQTTDDITALQLEGFQRWLMERGISHNTVSCYMRSLRSIIHQLRPERNMGELFKHVFTGKEHTEKRSVPTEDIHRLSLLQLRKDSSLAFSRDIFLFSFYALGMPFVDLAFLKRSQLHNGYIVYHRHKTGQRISIYIEEPMQQIINRYEQAGSPYVFPILKSTEPDKAYSQYETARARYNRHLRQLSLMAQTHRKLTSYVARHSWASIAYHANVDLSVISKALGHTSPNTTLTYIRDIDDQRIDRANRMLIEEISIKE